ncbi:hypothetical protein J1605_001613 [Eschrichtius robustus]|uniref:Uncharacterized protein n=1 Tax=Eschrichtius robustus TaxID=9764 RepID=A0AB34HZ94_ESCRO|nr:hypothetical protein J1605_001613 [Eschrichtius robustus]
MKMFEIQASSADLMIRNILLMHAGRYGCRVQTTADSVSDEAELLVRAWTLNDSSLVNTKSVKIEQRANIDWKKLLLHIGFCPPKHLARKITFNGWRVILIYWNIYSVYNFNSCKTTLNIYACLTT